MSERKNIPQSVFYITASVMFLCISALAVFGSIEVKRSADAIEMYYAEMYTYQQEMQAQAALGGEMAGEVLAYVAARALEDAEVLSPTDANEIAGEALQNISQRSERWGKIARAVNDAYLREMRLQ
ncbi:MAG: hypothetical protein AVO35_12775 [Candidatus Aegiribacteria sp. MLS_C]|jgi:hypothetical protein|nr:MAG: hypothetical protein AVO35_12775 [Candidatus Aegiribacteria sp. MLS_C]